MAACLYSEMSTMFGFTTAPCPVRRWPPFTRTERNERENVPASQISSLKTLLVNVRKLHIWRGIFRATGRRPIVLRFGLRLVLPVSANMLWCWVNPAYRNSHRRRRPRLSSDVVNAGTQAEAQGSRPFNPRAANVSRYRNRRLCRIRFSLSAQPVFGPRRRAIFGGGINPTPTASNARPSQDHFLRIGFGSGLANARAI